ncbi:hypothetical protein [Streptomyces sp. BRA346]|uniref:hypothetical protein n=1 Tax=Streptomyces sp. BRA346 TaxID=2878199 RepID=UPI00406313F9
MATTASIIRAAAQGIAAAIIATNSIRSPTSRNRYFLYTAVATIAILTILEPIRTSRKEKKEKRARIAENKLIATLGSALASIEEVTALRASEIGLQAFRIERRWWKRNWKDSQWWRHKEQLSRLARLRFNDTQPPSEIEWSEGKGVIGECWRVRRYHDFDFDTHHADQHNWEEHTWTSLPDKITMGMGWPEFEQVRGRYGVIAAFPIVHPQSNKLLGVLALDGAPSTYKNLTSMPVRKICSTAAARIADLFSDDK